MISSEVIEKPGWWRGLLLTSICVPAFFPALPLVWALFNETAIAAQGLIGDGFLKAILHSLGIAVSVALSAVLCGIPAGVLAALYDFPGRRVLLAFLAIPIVIPSFILAIGYSSLHLSGGTGVVLTFSSPGISLVLFITFLSARQLSKSQIEAARLVGGEFFLLYQVGKAVAPAAFLTAVLAGILTLPDPGPGQIFSFSVAASEMLVSFSALFDFSLAVKQCAIISAIVLFLFLPVAILIAPRIAISLLGKATQPNPLLRSKRMGWIGFVLLCLLLLVTAILPLSGILKPLVNDFPMLRPLQEFMRTITDTFTYALASGGIATVLGFILAIAIGRQNQRRRNLLIVLFLILSLPPALNALGILKLGTIAPAWLDPLLRSRFTVVCALALRFFPVAAILAMKSFGSIPVSRALAAGLHGIPLWLYVRRVLVPTLFPSAILSCMIVALLATAEVGTVLLLRPPGADSLPVQIFTVMANAPESLVAALCFFHVAGVSALLITGFAFARKVRAA